MVVYAHHLGNQRQQNGGDIGAATGRNRPKAEVGALKVLASNQTVALE